MTKSEEQFNILYQHAITESDATLHRMLEVYMHHPKDWGDFLLDIILTQSLVNNSLREQLIHTISNKSAAPIYHNGTYVKFVPDGDWPEDYAEVVPDGAWPGGS